jgi:hypothetical protein
MLHDPIDPGANPKGKVPQEAEMRSADSDSVHSRSVDPKSHIVATSVIWRNIETCAGGGIGNAVCRCFLCRRSLLTSKRTMRAASCSSVSSAKGCRADGYERYVADSIKSSMFCVFSLPMNAVTFPRLRFFQPPERVEKHDHPAVIFRRNAYVPSKSFPNCFPSSDSVCFDESG